MAWTKKIKKIPKKAYKKVYGSRKFPQAVSATGKVAKDVASLAASVGMIMSRLNVEKKSNSVDVYTWKTGQVSGTATTGFFAQEVTPTITQGTDSNQRIGNSLKVTGMNFPIQFNSQEQCRSARKLRVMLFRTTNDSYNAFTLISDYFDNNPLNGLIDMNSPRKYATTKQNGIKLVRSQNYYLKAPSVSVAGDTDESCLSVNFAVKSQDIFRYNDSTISKPDGIRYFLYIFCDAGNADGGTPATADIPIKTPASGVDVRVAQKYWYVDN